MVACRNKTWQTSGIFRVCKTHYLSAKPVKVHLGLSPHIWLHLTCNLNLSQARLTGLFLQPMSSFNIRIWTSGKPSHCFLTSEGSASNLPPMTNNIIRIISIYTWFDVTYLPLWGIKVSHLAQRWNVTKYIYPSNVHKCYFKV